MKELYPAIFKRKSFHFFKNYKTKNWYQDSFKLTDGDIDEIYTIFKSLKPLDPSIKVDIKIVPESLTTCNRGAEYCILFYSEKRANYLQNIGFIGEQLDLALVSRDIGTLWFGIGKTVLPRYNDLDFVTMMAICKVPTTDFRRDMFKSKRKEASTIWDGDKFKDVANIARFAPSSCNTQPWKVVEKNNTLEVYRYHESGKRGIMPVNKVIYQNLIDIGIFALFVSLVLEEQNIKYNLTSFLDTEASKEELTLDFIFVLDQ